MNTLPALTGTEKQIDWASKIRSQALVTFEKAVANTHDDISRVSDTAKAELAAAIEVIRGELFSRDNAEFWISMKDHFSQSEVLSYSRLETLCPITTVEIKGRW